MMQRFHVASNRAVRGHSLPRRRAYRDAPSEPRGLAQGLLEDPRLLAPSPVDGQDHPEQPLVLVVSRERAAALPMLREILRGEPEVTIVVDRRFGERRGDDDPADLAGERRVAQRRRRFSFYLL